LLDPGIKTRPVITRTAFTGSDGDVWRKRGDASWTQNKASLSSSHPSSPSVVITTSDSSRSKTNVLPSSSVNVHKIFREIEEYAKELRLEVDVLSGGSSPDEG
jgi:hypothetical protein